jgi:hypothetical protein
MGWRESSRPELFGFSRTGAVLEEAIAGAIDALLAKGLIGEGSGGIAMRV